MRPEAELSSLELDGAGLDKIVTTWWSLMRTEDRDVRAEISGAYLAAALLGHPGVASDLLLLDSILGGGEL